MMIKKWIILMIVLLICINTALATVTVTRSFSSLTVNPGDELTVTLTVTVANEISYTITEFIPSTNWFISNSAGGSIVIPGKIKWFVPSPTNIQYSYKLIVPNDPGTRTFSGTYSYGTTSGVVIGGDNTITVTDQAPSDFCNPALETTRACGTDIGECTAGTQSCILGRWTACGGAYVGPSTEICDTLDNDCDGESDDGSGESWFEQLCDGADADSCAEGTFTCSAGGQICTDTLEDSVETCDGADNDCDGSIDEDLTAPLSDDQDGVCYGSNKLCDGTNGWINNYNIITDYQATETWCDTLDNDCDGLTDEDVAGIDHGLLQTFYYDADGDGYGDAALTQTACSAPANYVSNDDDCDDNNNAVNPGATESCDNDDNDCDGTVDGFSGACGTDVCAGTKTCNSGTWTSCSTANEHKGKCGICDNYGIIKFDNSDEANDCASDLDPCNGQEFCESVDTCGRRNIPQCSGSVTEIATCDNEPDAKPKTWDYRAAASSTCQKTSATEYSCINPSDEITHTCDKERCTAECISSTETDTETCSEQYTNRCTEENKLIIYTGTDGTNGDTVTITNSCPENCDTNTCTFTTCTPDCAAPAFTEECSVLCAAGCDAEHSCTPVDCSSLNGCVGGEQRVYANVNRLCTDCECELKDITSCSSYSTPGTDSDNDGYDTECGDCDDTITTGNGIHPGATEVCNGVNDDCDDQTDEGVQTMFYPDADGDSYGDKTSTGTLACDSTIPSGYVGNNLDCDDSATGNEIHPGAAEICDNKDNDCDTSVDEGASGISDSLKQTFYADKDGDGKGDQDDPHLLCAAATGYTEDDTDCDDDITDDPEENCQTNPGSYNPNLVDCSNLVYSKCAKCINNEITSDLCDGIDNDCNAATLDGAGETWFNSPITCGVGICAGTVGKEICSNGKRTSDCNPYANAQTESCNDATGLNNIDENCDGTNLNCEGVCDDDEDEYYGDNLNILQKAYCAILGYDSGDCDDSNIAINPAATEIPCNGIDENCNEADNEGTDADGDTYKINGGSCGVVDCDDNNIDLYPGTTITQMCGTGTCAGTKQTTCSVSGQLSATDCDYTMSNQQPCTNDNICSVNSICMSGVCSGGDTRVCNTNLCDGTTGKIFTGACDTGLGCTTVSAPAEVCDDNDNDCDGITDERCPNLAGFSSSLTTDLSNTTENDLAQVYNFSFGIEGKVKVEYINVPINLIDLDISGNVVIDSGYVDIDPTNVPALNQPSRVTMYNVTMHNPTIMRGNATCNDCQLISYQSNILIFTVPHWSSYSLKEGAYCGDKSCNGDEGCSNCAEDCGSCAVPVTPSGSSGGGGRYGGGWVPTERTFLISYDLFKKGYSRALLEKDQIKFDLTGKKDYHYVKIKTISDVYAVIELRSEPFEITLKQGEETDAELTGDRTNDINVKINKITYGNRTKSVVVSIKPASTKATQKQLKEQKPTEEKPAATCYDGIKNQGEEEADCGGPCSAKCIEEQPAPLPDTGKSVWIYIFAGIIAIAVLGGIAFVVYESMSSHLLLRQEKKEGKISKESLKKLNDYIHGCLAEGFKPEQIKQRLMIEGWNNKLLEKLFKSIKYKPAEKPKEAEESQSAETEKTEETEEKEETPENWTEDGFSTDIKHKKSDAKKRF